MALFFIPIILLSLLFLHTTKTADQSEDQQPRPDIELDSELGIWRFVGCYMVFYICGFGEAGMEDGRKACYENTFYS